MEAGCENFALQNLGAKFYIYIYIYIYKMNIATVTSAKIFRLFHAPPTVAKI